MHAVILAAGKNERLWDVVNPYEKPLVEIDGAPLLRTLIDIAREYCNRVVIVASVENAEKVRDLVQSHFESDRLRIVIQPEAVGPGDALLRGVEACDDDKVLVICGDNVMKKEDIGYLRAASRRANLAVGVATITDEAEAIRYTRITRNRNFVEGPVDDAPTKDGAWLVWLGPFIATRSALLSALQKGAGEYKYFRIGPHLNDVGTAEFVPMTVKDIGTPQSLAEAQANG